MTAPIVTTIHVHNTVTDVTSNKVLLFLQPVAPEANYLFSAWTVLNPGIGSSQTAELSTSFSGSIAEWGSSRGDYTDPVSLPLGESVTITNLNGQSSTINTGDIHQALTGAQVGMFNDSTTPLTDLSVTWYVNNKKVVETNNTAETTLNPNNTATFDLQQSVWVMFGQAPTITQTYTLQTFGTAVEIPIPNGATDVYIVAYTGPDGDTFKPVPAETFNAMVQAASANDRELRGALGDDAGDPQKMQIDHVTLVPNPAAPGFSGTGSVEVDTVSNRITRLSVNFGHDAVPAVGAGYTISFRYASGPHLGTLGQAALTCRSNGALAVFS